MNWEDCFTSQRTGQKKIEQSQRTSFQRDFDRIIFSPAFRRLQDKTQVFPLPGSSFVHNRLTHSLEVASVGRSFGAIVGERIVKEHRQLSEDAQSFYLIDLPNVIASACLAHDIGNPAFGHSGEKAISNYFIEHANEEIEGEKLEARFSSGEWQDLINFEGNANALRILCQKFPGKLEGGMQLTYTTLAALLKYPCDSSNTDKHYMHRKKYGFFQSEKAVFTTLTKKLNFIKDHSGEGLIFKRHPFVYLVEAADDICYRIMDMEDAFRLRILSKDIVSQVFLNILESLKSEDIKLSEIRRKFTDIGDENDSISYLRAKCISALVNECAEEFFSNEEAILNGSYNQTLIGAVEDRCGALNDLITLSVNKIYKHHSVVEIELAGYHVMSHLLGLFIPAVLKEHPNSKDKMILTLIPMQFRQSLINSPYQKAMRIIDYVSGMTDQFATELYRKTMGIEIAKHN
jgi:dGTPase